jgi:hypothetical protein
MCTFNKTGVYPKSHIHSFYELYATWLGRHGGTLFLGCDTKSGPLNHASTHASDLDLRFAPNPDLEMCHA